MAKVYLQLSQLQKEATRLQPTMNKNVELESTDQRNASAIHSKLSPSSSRKNVVIPIEAANICCELSENPLHLMGKMYDGINLRYPS